MSRREETRALLLEHFRRYPCLQTADVFKLLFQSAFGCEHLVSDGERALEYIRSEYSASVGSPALVEALDGEYSRVYLGYLGEGLSAETLARIFCLSARSEERGGEALCEKLSVARGLVNEGLLPITAEEFERESCLWRERGYCAVRHSETFRKEYRPSYRVIANEYVRALPLLLQIDKRLASGSERLVLAIEGTSACGKSTLAEMLHRIYGCTVFHMDDFFLRPEQRTQERFAEAGGNVDRERFLSEVLLPLTRGEAVRYRRFDCSTQTLGEYISAAPGRFCVVEGAYSMHPDLAPHYDLSVFLEISDECQRERIKRRNSPQLAEMFFGRWIPLERVYFEKMNVRSRCDLVMPNE